MKFNQLTSRKLDSLIKSGASRYYGDGGGLYLQICTKGGSRTASWVFRYSPPAGGHDRDMGLGSCQTLSLSDARDRARRCRQKLLDGIDPIEERRRRKDAARSQSAEVMTFKVATEKFLAIHLPTWKNEKHRAQWGSTLRDYAFPQLGARPLAAIDQAAINDAVSPLWQRAPETASRVKQRIERVVTWVRDGMAPPAPGASKRVKHHEALAFASLPGFMSELRERDSVSAAALQFTILTAARTSEVIGAKWTEIENGVWIVPASRMKAGKQHRVPLSRSALELLAQLPRDGEHIFLNGGGKPISNMAMFQLLRGMRPGLTVHGFRSAFSDWARERTHYARDVVEMALAHAIKDKTEAAYRRGDLLAKRSKLMEDWSNYCSSTPAEEGSNVVALHG